jgi:hypothetical protein
MVASVLLAASYGAIHNQISFSVGPVYFHEFKFIQFGIEPELHNRVGAALVGIRASWWMGLLLGMPIYLLALFVRGFVPFLRVFFRAAMITFGVTLLVGLTFLTIGVGTVDIGNLPKAMNTRDVSDPVAFAHAGIMHDASYFGGFIGMICGCIYTVIMARKP